MGLKIVAGRDRLANSASKERKGRAARWGRVALATAVSAVGAGAVSTPALAHSRSGHGTRYKFRTLDNQNDVTFNQLLGINHYGVIAGYFGSGAQGHPNQGYRLFPQYHQWDYAGENYPRSVQTQVTGLNDRGVTVGFWSDQNNANQVNDNFGFWESAGQFHDVNFPNPVNGSQTPPMNQLLGVNDEDVGVGFYVDGNGNNHGYTYDIGRNQYTEITIPNAASVTATGINNRGDISGFETDMNGTVHGFLRGRDNPLTILDAPATGTTITQALGVNADGEVVGVYTVGTGSTAQLHGFTWTRGQGFQTVDDPNGIGTTTINGVNDEGQLVGFYVDGNGNTDGLLAISAPTLEQSLIPAPHAPTGPPTSGPVVRPA